MHDPSPSHRRRPLGCLRGTFQPFTTPEPLHPLVIHPPPFPMRQLGDPPVIVTPVPHRQPGGVLHQPRLVVSNAPDAPALKGPPRRVSWKLRGPLLYWVLERQRK